MKLTLIVVVGKANRSEITVSLPAVIGRSREADLTIAHPMISRTHCEILEVDGLLKVRDLGSLNGTMVEGQRISEAFLRPQDEFSIGPLTFRADYQYDGEIDSLPRRQIQQQPRPEAGESGEAVPDFESLGETPRLPPVGPAEGRGAAHQPEHAGSEEQLGGGAADAGDAREIVDLEEPEEVAEPEDTSPAEPEPAFPPPTPTTQAPPASGHAPDGPADEAPEVGASEEVQIETADESITHDSDPLKMPSAERGRRPCGQTEAVKPPESARQDDAESPGLAASPTNRAPHDEPGPPADSSPEVAPKSDPRSPGEGGDEKLDEFLRKLK